MTAMTPSEYHHQSPPKALMKGQKQQPQQQQQQMGTPGTTAMIMSTSSQATSDSPVGGSGVIVPTNGTGSIRTGGGRLRRSTRRRSRRRQSGAGGGTSFSAAATGSSIASNSLSFTLSTQNLMLQQGGKVEVARGVFLKGTALEQYCTQRGLCPLCCKTKVRKKVFHLFSQNNWKPITQMNDSRDRYIVWKGYCLRDGCFTLSQAQRLTGSNEKTEEAGEDDESPAGGGGGDRKKLPPSRFGRRGIGNRRREGRRTNGGRNTNRNVFMRQRRGSDDVGNDDDYDDDDEVASPPPIQRIIPSQNNARPRQQQQQKDKPLSPFPPDDVKNRILSTSSSPSEAKDIIVQRTIEALQEDGEDGICQRLAVDTVNLSGLSCTIEDLSSIIKATAGVTYIKALNLSNSGLNDDHLGLFSKGIDVGRTNGKTKVLPLVQLNLSSNKITDNGVQSLCPYLEQTSKLHVLDLSKNLIGTMGAVSVFDSFHRSRSTRIKTINLSQNEIFDVVPFEEDPYNDDHDDDDCVDDDDDGPLTPAAGLEGFLGDNNTLSVLDLEGNFLHDESLISICAGLETNTSLTSINLSRNRIADDGVITLAECLVINKTLKEIDLSQNEITNIGGLALLAALDHNISIDDIKGLWRNKIERRFIIVAIRRLLLSTGRDHGGAVEASTSMLSNIDFDTPYETDDVVSDLSDDPLDPAELDTVDLDQSATLSSHEIQETCDNEKDRHAMGLELISSPHKTRSRVIASDLPSLPATGELAETSLQTQTPHHFTFDRIKILQSSPLVYFNKQKGLHQPIPLLDYKHELEVVKGAILNGCDGSESRIECSVEPATMDRFSASFSETDSEALLHLSCLGSPDGSLMFEDGYGSVQTLPLDGLKRLLALLKLPSFVFVASNNHAKSIADAFVEAGVKHVVCCERDMCSYRDPVTSCFMQTFYSEASKRANLNSAFDLALKEAVGSSPTANILNRIEKRFHLLPKVAEADDYHSVPIFFNQFVEEKGNDDELFEFSNDLPVPPSTFLGRELEMFDIIESMRVHDIVKVKGTPGYGKESILNMVGHYVLGRRHIFNIDHVFFLPAALPVEEDSLYGDLAMVTNHIRTSREGEWDTQDEILEVKERLQIELEALKIIIVVDDQSFSTQSSQQSLEKFISFLLNQADSKVVVVSNRLKDVCFPAQQNPASINQIEESVVEIDALDYRSTALLFAGSCRFITGGHCPLVKTPAEFADLIEPPFMSQALDPKTYSERRKSLYSMMGSGLPSAVLKAAQDMDKRQFMELIKTSKLPEMFINSLSDLERQLKRFERQKDILSLEKYFIRANDLSCIIEELNSMRRLFPTLAELKETERKMKSDLTDAISSRRYEDANDIKRDLHTIKKKIISELSESTTDDRNQFQAQIESLIEEANESFNIEDLGQSVLFSITSTLTLSVVVGDIVDFRLPDVEAKGVVVFTNEACDLTLTDEGQNLLEHGGDTLKSDVMEVSEDGTSLSSLTAVDNQEARCSTGNAVIVGPAVYDKLNVPIVILTAGPFTPSGGSETLLSDSDYLHYSEVMLRSCYRSALVLSKHAELKALGLRLLTTRKRGQESYLWGLRHGLTTILEEVESTQLSELHIMARTSREKDTIVTTLTDMGLARV